MNKKPGFKNRSLVLILFLLIAVWAGPIAIRVFSANDPVPLEHSDTIPALNNEVSLYSAAQAMTHGDFELARPCLDRLKQTQRENNTVRPLFTLLDNYDHLMGKLQDERSKAYQKNIDALNKILLEIQWRESVLKASRSFVLELKAKQKLEKDIENKLDTNRLDALVQLGSAHVLSDRMNLPDQVDPSVRDDIISQCLKIADHLEAEGKWLDAWSKVYAYLTTIDKQKYEYDDLYRRLLRQATLKAMYVPDPNTEGVGWQEHREGINTNIIYTALEMVSREYVEDPDYHKMERRAIENCRLLAQTEDLKQTFESLNDPNTVTAYLELLQEAENKFNEMIKVDYSHLLWQMGNVLIINQQTLKLPNEVIMAEFTEGAFSALDSYTYIIWPRDVEEFQKDMTNEFTGIGIVINKDKDKFLKVDSLVSYDHPAYKAGLDANDIILAIDGKEAQNLTLEKAVRLITGPAGTDVVLTIDRKGFDKPRDYTVTRQHVVVPTVKGLCRNENGQWNYFVDQDKGIAYVHLTHFAGETPGSLRETLETLKQQGMKALVLDLRSNSGGYLSGAVEIADLFIPSGRIVSSRSSRVTSPTSVNTNSSRSIFDRMFEKENHRLNSNIIKEDVNNATTLGTFDDQLPLVVLINSASASASEIVAGALKDHNRALIIGTRSFGKGNVQTIKQLMPSSAQVKMTIAYYYLPSGRKVHRDPEDKQNEDYGVEPHIEIELTNDQIMAFLKGQHDAGVLYHNNLPDAAPDRKIFDVPKTLETDPQLRMALLCLSARVWTDSHTEMALAASEN
ncbi:MAG: S41 family peptidase [Sedimentisphaerales bacterium]|nr:S41 family peptidase [Sedimentisphaerales bacterium]